MTAYCIGLTGKAASWAIWRQKSSIIGWPNFWTKISIYGDLVIDPWLPWEKLPNVFQVRILVARIALWQAYHERSGSGYSRWQTSWYLMIDWKTRHSIASVSKQWSNLLRLGSLDHDEIPGDPTRLQCPLCSDASWRRDVVFLHGETTQKQLAPHVNSPELSLAGLR